MSNEWSTFNGKCDGDVVWWEERGVGRGWNIKNNLILEKYVYTKCIVFYF